MFEIRKRTGSYVQPIPGAPLFENRSLAEQWAREFIEKYPRLFRRGLEAIEVGKIHGALRDE
jgi:hypothetical protein